jgi:DNA-binding response OmpR family regulator
MVNQDPNIKSKKILIVDDDEFLLDMYALKFRESDFSVEVARSGEEALTQMRQGLNPAVILLDIVMPNIDGLEFLRVAKKENLLRDSMVVVLSNLGQKEDIERGLKLGAQDYIVKAHFTPSEVVKKVLALLERKK